MAGRIEESMADAVASFNDCFWNLSGRSGLLGARYNHPPSVERLCETRRSSIAGLHAFGIGGRDDIVRCGFGAGVGISGRRCIAANGSPDRYAFGVLSALSCAVHVPARLSSVSAASSDTAVKGDEQVT
jgi:hypothetical protein